MDFSSFDPLPGFGSFFGDGGTAGVAETDDSSTTAAHIHRLTITTVKTGYTWQRVYGKIDSNIQKLVPTYRAMLDKVKRGSYQRIGTVQTFDVTRDGWYCLSRSGSRYQMVNSAYEPFNGMINFVGQSIYYEHSGEFALKLYQSGSQVVKATPYPHATKIGRDKADVASGVMVHVGGVYHNSYYKRHQLGGSLGCFGVISPANKITDQPFSDASYRTFMRKAPPSNVYYRGIVDKWKAAIKSAPFTSNNITGLLLTIKPRTLVTRSKIGRQDNGYYNEYWANKSQSDVKIGQFSNFLSR